VVVAASAFIGLRLLSLMGEAAQADWRCDLPRYARPRP
jgi:hypothetical protein